MCNFDKTKLSKFMESKQLLERALKKEFLSDLHSVIIKTYTSEEYKNT